MAERIVSPGVFTEEKDQSFLQQGIAEIGAALIGPTVKGPAFVPTVVNGFDDFRQKFGGFSEKYYVPYSAKNYLKDAGRATIVRILGTDGYSVKHPLNVVATGSWGKRSIAFLHPSYVVSNDDSDSLFALTTLASNESGSFVLTLSGSFTTDTSTFTNAIDKNGTAFSASIDINSNSFIGDIFGYNPEGTLPVYNYTNFKYDASASIATDGATSIIIESGSASPEFDFSDGYKEAETPWITSQDLGGGSTQNLFKIKTLSHGDVNNFEFKVGITNIKAAGTIAGSEYGEFTVVIRKVDQNKIPVTPFKADDEDIRPNVVEQFVCNLNPDSPNFISRVIGDKYLTTDTNGKVTVNGDYPNQSKNIRVEVSDAVKNGAVSVNLVPFGFRALTSPIPNGFTQPVSASFKTTQTSAGTYNKRVYFGFDYDFANTDNLNYLKPLPITANQTTGSNTDFLLSNYNQHASANYPSSTNAYSGSIGLTSSTSIDSRKFIVPLQGGFDGMKPHTQRKTGTHIVAGNTQGFDISSTSAAGYTAYKRAIDAISNKDEYDINMLLTPGVLHQYHSSITTYAKDTVEDRADAFYVMDGFDIDANISTAVTNVSAIDSNYTSCYYPWVKIMDTEKNKPVWVPPSCVIPGVIAFNDRVAAPWFAPAGLNRGGLTEAVEVRTRLTHAERDTLYEGRINPIAVFPNTGISVWGQKTLQGKPSALDRINVRRLLIAAKKFIASSSKYLVFENNTSQTRNRFLNIVNPYLESVQQRQGLYAFRVIMDETNNGPEVIDRNQLVGQIYLKPAKTAEFILLDFNILPTGASFDE